MSNFEDRGDYSMAAPYAEKADFLLCDHEEYQSLKEGDEEGERLLSLRSQAAAAHALTSISISLREIAYLLREGS